jgi:hypothetical protein
VFENDDPKDRKELIRRLIAKGMPSFEFNSGSGIIHVVVPLIESSGSGFEINAQNEELIMELKKALENNPYNPHLFIATNSLRTSCEIGLMGEDAYGNFISTGDWEYTPDIEKAQVIFDNYWNSRDKWIRKWVAGELRSEKE